LLGIPFAYFREKFSGWILFELFLPMSRGLDCNVDWPNDRCDESAEEEESRCVDEIDDGTGAQASVNR
jgi:hypothetical protein